MVIIGEQMKLTPFFRVLFVGLAFGMSTLLASCEVGALVEQTALPAEPAPTATPLVEAMFTFRVALPEPLQPGDSVYLTILDEVSGLALNPTRHLMQAEDPQHFFVILPFELNSLLKYRYSRDGSRYAEEHLSDGRMVRYRMLRVDGPGVVQDIVSRWTDSAFRGPTGRISGQVRDMVSGQPIPNLLVSAGGASSLTISDGSFLLEGLPPGTHHLLAYALDGSYQLYQQGALVAADSTTPAPLELSPAKMVWVEFIVSPPPGTIPAVPVRLAGSLYQLGNTFGDLRGGVSLMATRMPVLQPLPDGRYSLTLELPAGEDLRYKYTLGDGFWNAERYRNGSTRLRRLIVPDRDTTIEDTIATWSNGPTAPITFDLTTPDNTPAGEMVSIQLNPRFGWTEPIPMWPVGGNRWIYVLFSPLQNLETLAYRFCRNEQCGVADDVRTAGSNSPGFLVSPAGEAQVINDRVESWTWLDQPLSPISVPNLTINSRGPGFMAGIEFLESYHPSWQAHIPAAMIDIAGLHANWVVTRPTWTFTRQNLPVMEAVPGQDSLWPDLVAENELASGLGLQVAFFPAVRFPIEPEEWWQQANRDFAWWVVWLERYESFILHHAGLAEAHGVDALILGGEWLEPALPGGLVKDGSSSRVPEDAEARWRALLAKVRSRYTGKLLWALTFPQGLQSPPAFIDEFDQVYVLWSAELTVQPGGGETQMTDQAIELLDTVVRPFYEMTGKPVVLGLAYASASMEAAGSSSEDLSGEINLQQQVDAYNAMMVATNGAEWVEGFVSRGYYPPAVLQDASASLHGKPARGVLWYWFQRILAE
jgi:hypothetical protein